jgi:hypothetical protein
LAIIEEARATTESPTAGEEEPLNFPQTIFRKVAYLLWYGMVNQRNRFTYMVDGVHSTYTVREAPDGRITCDCGGFKGRGVCSHSVAVVMIIESARLEEKPDETQEAKNEEAGERG